MLYALAFFAIVFILFSFKMTYEEHDEQERLRKLKDEAIKKNQKYFYTGYKQGEKYIKQDVETGDRFIERQVGDHWCTFTPSGRLIRDYAQEYIDEYLSGEKERAAKEGRRLYMIDYRRGESIEGAQRVKYRDLLNGNIYNIRTLADHTVVLVDVKTGMIYDALKQKDGRGYLQTSHPDDAKKLGNLEEYIGKLNHDVSWIFNSKERFEFLRKRGCYSYVQPRCTEDDVEEKSKMCGTYWANMLNVEVRDEFRGIKEFPLVMYNNKPASAPVEKTESLI